MNATLEKSPTSLIFSNSPVDLILIDSERNLLFENIVEAVMDVLAFTRDEASEKTRIYLTEGSVILIRTNKAYAELCQHELLTYGLFTTIE
jgi:hypothetical protein